MLEPLIACAQTVRAPVNCGAASGEGGEAMIHWLAADRLRRYLLLTTAAALLTACAAAPAPVTVSRSSVGVALLAFDVVNQHRSSAVPSALELVVEDEHGRQRRVVRLSEPLAASEPPRAEFLFALELPAGQHRVRAVNGRLRAGAQDGVLAHAIEIPFEVEADRTRFLGRLSFINVARRDRRDQASGPAYPAPAQHQLGLADGTLEITSRFALDDELTRFRTAYPALALQWVEAAPLETIRVERAPQSGLPPYVLSFAEMDASTHAPNTALPSRRVAEVAAPTRAADAAQRAWRDFSAARLPRAFALGADGVAWGWAAARDDAWLVALDQCARRGPGCRLYAIDERVVARD